MRIVEPDKEGIGEVQVQSRTVMAGYLKEPELTAETIVDGWLRTGDLGRFDHTGNLQLFGRKKNMIVTEEGKNIYPEDIEAVFEPLPVKEFCVFAANYIWPQRSMVGEQLLLVIHLENGQSYNDELKKSGFVFEWASAQLQTRSWNRCLRRRFSAHRIDEDKEKCARGKPCET